MRVWRLTSTAPMVGFVTGTILKLGTQVHHDQLLKGIDSLDAVGCFALTELGYGK